MTFTDKFTARERVLARTGHRWLDVQECPHCGQSHSMAFAQGAFGLEGYCYRRRDTASPILVADTRLDEKVWVTPIDELRGIDAS